MRGPDYAPTAASTFRQLLQPASIAIVGASESSFYGSLALKNLSSHGYPGLLYPINPRYERVLGHKAYPSLDELPAAPDCVIVITRPELAVEAVDQALRIGAGSIVIYAQGFSDAKSAEGDHFQVELVRLAGGAGIPVLGPNCLGVVAPWSNTIAFGGPIRGPIRPGGIALVVQSGAVATATLMSLGQRGAGFSYAVSTGNEAVLTTVDILELLVEDERTDVICLFLESIRQPARFLRACERARAREKPIIALEVGRTNGGRRAAQSHTGALAGTPEVHDAVFRRMNVVRAESLEEMMETALVFAAAHRKRAPNRGRIFVTTASGGAAGLICDEAGGLGIDLPEPSPALASRLATVIPPSGSVANPMDVSGQAAAQPDLLLRVLNEVTESGEADAIVYVHGSGFPGEDQPQHIKLLEHVTSVAETRQVPVVFASLMPHALTEWQHAFLAAHPSLAATQGVRATLRAVQALLRYEGGSSPRRPRTTGMDPSRRRNGTALDEELSLGMLDRVGIPTVKRRVVDSIAEARAAAQTLGFPLAVKVCSSHIAHKSSLGGVWLNIGTSDHLERTCALALDRLRLLNVPDGRLMLQRMVTGGTEVILGGVLDAEFGPGVLIGPGGVLAEQFDDHRVALAPTTAVEVRELLQSLKAYSAIAGTVDAPRDIDGLVDAIVRFADLLVMVREEIVEFDVNPIVVLPKGQGVVALDALAVRASQPAGDTA